MLFGGVLWLVVMVWVFFIMLDYVVFGFSIRIIDLVGGVDGI